MKKKRGAGETPPEGISIGQGDLFGTPAPSSPGSSPRVAALAPEPSPPPASQIGRAHV